MLKSSSENRMNPSISGGAAQVVEQIVGALDAQININTGEPAEERGFDQDEPEVSVSSVGAAIPTREDFRAQGGVQTNVIDQDSISRIMSKAIEIGNGGSTAKSIVAVSEPKPDRSRVVGGDSKKKSSFNPNFFKKTDLATGQGHEAKDFKYSNKNLEYPHQKASSSDQKNQGSILNRFLGVCGAFFSSDVPEDPVQKNLKDRLAIEKRLSQFSETISADAVLISEIMADFTEKFHYAREGFNRVNSFHRKQEAMIKGQTDGLDVALIQETAVSSIQQYDDMECDALFQELTILLKTYPGEDPKASHSIEELQKFYDKKLVHHDSVKAVLNQVVEKAGLCLKADQAALFKSMKLMDSERVNCKI